MQKVRTLKKIFDKFSDESLAFNRTRDTADP